MHCVPNIPCRLYYYSHLFIAVHVGNRHRHQLKFRVDLNFCAFDAFVLFTKVKEFALVKCVVVVYYLIISVMRTALEYYD